MRIGHPSGYWPDRCFGRECSARDHKGHQGAAMTRKSAVLPLSCPDRKGVVAAISGFIAQHGGNILHADEHGDAASSTFLMRAECEPAGLDLPPSDFASHPAATATEG